MQMEPQEEVIMVPLNAEWIAARYAERGHTVTYNLDPVKAVRVILSHVAGQADRAAHWENFLNKKEIRLMRWTVSSRVLLSCRKTLPVNHLTFVIQQSVSNMYFDGAYPTRRTCPLVEEWFVGACAWIGRLDRLQLAGQERNVEKSRMVGCVEGHIGRMLTRDVVAPLAAAILVKVFGTYFKIRTFLNMVI